MKLYLKITAALREVWFSKFMLSSVYGANGYNSSNYNGTGQANGAVHDWTIMLFIAMIVAGLSLSVWLWRRRKRKSS